MALPEAVRISEQVANRMQRLSTSERLQIAGLIHEILFTPIRAVGEPCLHSDNDFIVYYEIDSDHIANITHYLRKYAYPPIM